MLAHEKKKKKELTVQSDEGLLGVEGEWKERHKARILRASKRLSTSHAEPGPRDLSAPALIRVGIPYSRYVLLHSAPLGPLNEDAQHLLR